MRAKTLAMSALVGLGRHTISGMLCASNQQFYDWSAAYRLFEKQRFNQEELFKPVRRTVLAHLDPEVPIVAMMDDTLIRKRGRKVHGTSWRRDPLGPAFTNNFVWGQRFLQISAALPSVSSNSGQARGIPVDLCHAPSATKPGKNAPEEAWEEYRKLQQSMKISILGSEHLSLLRDQLNEDTDGKSRKLVMSVDGSFTNRAMFRSLPANTVLIGRIRKDAKLFEPAVEKPRRGRPRWYGSPVPTPEQIRQDDSVPWSEIEAFAAGKVHTFRIKTLSPLRWSGTGPQNIRLVIIAPLAYRPRKGAKLLYRDPTYLICTDPELPLTQLLQAYLWRWEIEVNFRDEKTLLGVGQAQVRTPLAAENVPVFIVAAYAFLLLASANSSSSSLPPPKWYPRRSEIRDSTACLIGTFRSELWGKGMGLNLTHLTSPKHHHPNTSLLLNSLPSAVCYAFY